MPISKTVIILSLLTLLFTSVPVRAERCVILVLSGSTSRAFWSEIVDGAVKAGDELGYMIYARGTVNDNDDSTQIKIAQNFLSAYHCEGIVIAPSNSNVNRYVSRLKKQGIPAIYIDRDTGGERAAVIKTDNYSAGKLAAQKLSDVLGKKGNVVLFRLQKGVVSTDARESGFIEEAQRIGLTIVASPYIGTIVGSAKRNATSALHKAENIDGIFTPNDTTTIGTMIALRSSEKHKNVVHLGFDKAPFIVDGLKKGALTGYITQSPYQMGYQSIYAINKVLRGESISDEITTPVNYVTHKK
ncbi:substrate-binding domain-containing protein [Vibrio salinus]|uniref:substrate-binding domain-containing protein n=1 Tax=Vibrio salinus TaxID=2899784 RepID=UPI001E541AE6|nr:substrate-binding domain-containing protein [Vibrio salinus]MCE0495217.1 substrate-binding domain-containing protein [Vibrio salinus]